MCVYVCMYVCVYVGVYVCVYVCMYVCMRVCMYVCMYVCVGVRVCTDSNGNSTHVADSKPPNEDLQDTWTELFQVVAGREQSNPSSHQLCTQRRAYSSFFVYIQTKGLVLYNVTVLHVRRHSSTYEAFKERNIK